MTRDTLNTWIAIAFCWAFALTAVLLFRPLMPVDETRYMTVAWEMLVRDTWLLPTLNYEPYSHKPPLLFWIIRGSWEIFGVHVWPVRITLGVVIIGLFGLVARLAQTLFPNEEKLPSRSMLLLAALPVFLVYASMIMFDSLLAVFVVTGLIAIWHAAQDTNKKSWLLLGLALGGGILAKGPVALVYILPAALLAPVWAGTQPSWKGWYGRIALAVLMGASIALLWAIPAAITGGPAYAQKIFLSQSAGRMVNAFDHQEPFWFYFPVALAFVAPLLLWPAFWRNIKSKVHLELLNGTNTRSQVRFLLCQILPVFIFFTAISSKQIHYMVPLLPAFSVLAALFISRGHERFSAGMPALLSAVPSIVLLCEHAYVVVVGHEIKGWAHIMDGFMPWVAVTHVGIALALAWYSERHQKSGFKVLAAAAMLLLAFTHMQLGQSFFPRYDLSRLKPYIDEFRANPLAVAPKYDGEYGYELRLTKPVSVFEDHLVDDWLSQHRNTIVITRVDNITKHQPMYYYPLGSMLYRENKRIDILGYKLRPYEKLYWRESPLYYNKEFMKDKK
ncbi:MAG: glycosyltransferase family 39 protein [Alphaproteobacteria bacterium]|nr:glycosyltransferase family 39 protein [Alphaproteobacteria bacterium]